MKNGIAAVVAGAILALLGSILTAKGSGDIYGAASGQKYLETIDRVNRTTEEIADGDDGE